MNRYWDKIQSLGEHAHLRRSTPMFPPLTPPSDELGGYEGFDRRMGRNDNDPPRDSIGTCEAIDAFVKLGTFAERNAKKSQREKALDKFHGKTLVYPKGTTPIYEDGEAQEQALRAPREFRIGDTVECLPDKDAEKDRGRKEDCLGKKLVIRSFERMYSKDLDGVQTAAFHHGNWWPVRALRLANAVEGSK